MGRFLQRVLHPFRRRRFEADLAEELRAHLEMQEQANRAAGMNADEAHFAARRQFGHLDGVKETAREQRSWVWLEQFVQDVRHAARQLAKAPAFTAVVVLSLALGIGANTAVFGLANAVLLKSLPVKDPQQLVIFNWLGDQNVRPYSYGGWLQQEAGTGKHTSTSFSISTFEAFQKQSSPLAEIFAFAGKGRLYVSVDGDREIVNRGQVVSGNYFVGLGVSAAVGRLIEPSDDRPGAVPVAVISYEYWQRRFGGDPAVVGKSVSIDGVPLTLIGVTAPGFHGALQAGQTVELTLPLALAQRMGHDIGDDRDPNFWWVRIMGRLRPGATRAQAAASLQGTFEESVRGHLFVSPLSGAPAVDPGQIPLPRLRAESGAQGLSEARRYYERPLRLLLGFVALVLLIACINIANLQLARGNARHREIAVRLALGASRGRVICQLLTESGLLAALGAGLGLVFAAWGTRALTLLQPFGSGTLQFDTAVDGRVLGFTAAVAVTTGLLIGLAPALRTTRPDLVSRFQGGPRTLGAGSRSALAKALMVTQVALSLILLVAAGLFVRTLRNLDREDVGFNRAQLLLFDADASAAGASGSQAMATYDRMRERIAALPAVRDVSYASLALLSESNWNTTVVVPGSFATKRPESVRVNNIDPAYLKTMEIPLLRGRDFTARDQAGAPRVAIVNQSFARTYFGTEDVIGKQFYGSAGSAKSNTEIVGLVRDTKYSEIKQLPGPVVFFPYPQQDRDTIHAASFVIRFTGPEDAIVAAVRQIGHDVDAGIPMTEFRTQQQQIDRLFTQERCFAVLCSFLGALAGVLTVIGLYGLMSYAVLRRTGEIGLRMALGAMPTNISHLILRESLGLVLLGVCIGTGAALGVARLAASLMFRLSPADPVTYASASILLMGVASLAAWLPARRAAKVDPVVALRAE